MILFYVIVWTRSFIHKTDKHIKNKEKKHVTEEELAMSWFRLTGRENETTSTQILQQQWR